MNLSKIYRTEVNPSTLRVGEIVATLEERLLVTPDFPKLASLKKFPIFVWGTEQFHGEHHDFLEHADYLGSAHTISKEYTMHDNGIQPFLYKGLFSEGVRQKVRGELYNVSVEHIHVLDNFYERGHLSERILDRIIMEEQKSLPFDLYSKFGGFQWCHAFVYIQKYEMTDDAKNRVRWTTTLNNSHAHLSYLKYYKWDADSTPYKEDENSDEWWFQQYGRGY